MTNKKSSEILADKVEHFLRKIWFPRNKGECFIGSGGWTLLPKCVTMTYHMTMTFHLQAL